METIHKQEELIFKEYQALLDDNREISPDGLHYLGAFYYTDNCWGRYCGDEEKLWQSFCKLKRGLVILTKDLNDSIAWDIREEHARKMELKSQCHPCNMHFIATFVVGYTDY